jgi:hypothetical protein
LRTELQVRIGGAAVISFAKPILDSFLQRAQEALYEVGEWKHLRASAVIDVADGSIWYDLPTDCNLERIEGVWILSWGAWLALREGISVQQRNFSAPADPCRYEIRWNADAVNPSWKVQIELHPEPIVDSKLRIEYVRSLLPFTEDSHVASIPTGPLFLHALTNAKLHYRQPDGPQYAQQLEAMLLDLKGRHRRATVVTPRSERRVLDEDVPYLLPPTSVPGG